MEVTVVVATYGDPSWAELAATRAVPSAAAQAPVVQVHGATLHDARNSGLDQVATEWVCFLDADDELEPGYLDAMARATGDLRAPAVRYVRDGRRPARAALPRVAGHRHDCDADCLEWGNWLVVGTLVRADLVRSVGGWRDFPWSEDFDLWARCWKAGAMIKAVPRAVYRAHVRAGSRNRAPSPAEKLAAHQAIARANGLPVPA